ncbi:MAG: hypothetical protein HQL63_04675 [Magnetococcales bacterium]|nr:hypothetical protein [Magnetococcales bacterium]
MSTPGFESICGHREALARLQGFLQSGRVPHAMIFSGPSGIGKASVACAFAAALFCHQQTRSGAGMGCSGCGRCERCRTIHDKVMGGYHPDLVRVGLLSASGDGREAEDAGSGEKLKTRIVVEQIRELCSFLALTPLEAGCKVAIVDDAALMNEGAAHALLKTLEEPPPGSLLVLNTRRLGALLPTIRSRCQMIRFFPLSREELMQVASRQLADMDQETRDEAINHAEGSVSRLIQLCTSDFKELKDRFYLDMEKLPRCSLAALCEIAAFWTHKKQPERFLLAQAFLMAWFRDNIRESVSCWQTGGSAILALDLGRKSREMFRQAETFNLNRQMVMETLLIHLARWRGASF